MPKAKKMPSGKWQCRIYDYTDASGKEHQKSFTAETKREAERLATVYKHNSFIQDMAVAEAVDAYIKSKEAVLSPSTIRSYLSIYKTHFETSRFGAKKLSRLTLQTVQIWVSSLQEGRKPKTVKNIYNLFTPAMEMFRPELNLPVTLPAPMKPELHTPTVAEVEALIEFIKTDRDLFICSLLCAFGPMRRSEACAIKFSDIDNDANTITVRRAQVYAKDKTWVFKDIPKTYASYRTITYPKEVIQAIGRGFGYVISKSTPGALSDRYRRAVKNAQLPHFRMHDLRHYATSVLHAIGIPDQYIVARGGWTTDYCMKRVYRDTMSDIEKEMNQRAVDFFSTNLVSNLASQNSGTA